MFGIGGIFAVSAAPPNRKREQMPKESLKPLSLQEINQVIHDWVNDPDIDIGSKQDQYSLAKTIFAIKLAYDSTDHCPQAVEWEKEFDDFWKVMSRTPGTMTASDKLKDAVKSFIRSLLERGSE